MSPPLDATGWILSGMLALANLVLVALGVREEIDRIIERDDELARAEHAADLYKAAAAQARAEIEELRARVARLQAVAIVVTRDDPRALAAAFEELLPGDLPEREAVTIREPDPIPRPSSMVADDGTIFPQSSSSFTFGGRRRLAHRGEA